MVLEILAKKKKKQRKVRDSVMGILIEREEFHSYVSVAVFPLDRMLSNLSSRFSPGLNTSTNHLSFKIVICLGFTKQFLPRGKANTSK
jgi:hypothetical protein